MTVWARVGTSSLTNPFEIESFGGQACLGNGLVDKHGLSAMF